MNKKVTIQGYEGSFHQVAARQFFGKTVEVITCDTFREVVKIGADVKQSDGAVMAIENSIAGSILPNYNLLQKSNLQVIGEVYLQISQNLLVNPVVKLSDIKEVHSHPMAILQCLDFLEQHPYKLVESEDTALSAKMVHQHKSKHVAAVASKLAAKNSKEVIQASRLQALSISNAAKAYKSGINEIGSQYIKNNGFALSNFNRESEYLNSVYTDKLELVGYGVSLKN